MQDAFNVRRNRKPASELIPEALNGELKAGFECADVILRLRLVDAPLDQCHIETVAEPARALFKSLQHVADLTSVITVRLRLRLYTQIDDDWKQEQNKKRSGDFHIYSHRAIVRQSLFVLPLSCFISGPWLTPGFGALRD